MFFIDGYDYASGAPVVRRYYYSVIDALHPEDGWLLGVSIIVNIMLLATSLSGFIIQKPRLKKILPYVLIVFLVPSILFLVLTLVIGTKDPSGILPKPF